MMNRLTLVPSPIAFLLLDKDGNPRPFHGEPTEAETAAFAALFIGLVSFACVAGWYPLRRWHHRGKGKLKMSYFFWAVAGSSLGLIALGIAGNFFY
jgi:hypothetical protein